MKKISCLIIALVIVLTTTIGASAANEEVNILLNGKAVIFTDDSGYPYVDENNRTMVPLRVTMESAGFVVGYDSDAQTAIVISDHNRIEVPIGTNKIYTNNQLTENDTIAVVKDGRTFLPIRAVLENTGYTVEWANDTRTVNAYTFAFDANEFVPYSTSNLSTLVENILKGNVVYINGGYYATPEYIKLLTNVQVHYTGDDLNTAIYPQTSRYDLADIDFETAMDQQNSNDYYLDNEDIPNYERICKATNLYDTTSFKVYDSQEMKTYNAYLGMNGFELISDDFTHVENSQSLTTYGDIYVYKDKNDNFVELYEMEDKGLDKNFVFLFVNEKFNYPKVYEFISRLAAEKYDSSKIKGLYKYDENNYKYGNIDSVYGAPIYARKEKVKSVQDFKKFLEQKYRILYSPMEDFELDIETWDNSTSSDGLSFAIHVDFSYVSEDYDVITAYNFAEKYGYSDAQKNKTVELIKDMMGEICQDAEDCFPNAEVSGCIYVDGYHYPHIKVDYYSDTALSWSNSSGKFKWTPSNDTFELMN